MAGLLDKFSRFKQEKLEEAEWHSSSLFAEGFCTPARRAGMQQPDAAEYVKWSEVQAFLQMAEQALKVRSATNEALAEQLACTKSEKTQVEKTSSAAQEESSFLAEHMQELLSERAALKEALDQARRERDYLASENALLRQELLEGAALGEESNAALQLLARQGEELRAAQRELLEAQQRSAALENDNVQLQARVSALERANTAQQTAMLSCLEESERVRLQQLSLACESPVGPLAEPHVSRRSEFTDDSSAFEASGLAGGIGRYGSGALTLELPSEASGSFVTCLTPGTVGSSGLESIFHSVSPSPAVSPDLGSKQQARQQQQQQQQEARPPSRSSAGSKGSGQSGC